MRITVALILALILALLVTIFAVQNNEPTDITFIAWKTEGSLALILMITFALGILIGLLVSAPGSIKRRRQFADLKKHLRSLEQDLDKAFTPNDAPPESEPEVEPASVEKPGEEPEQDPDTSEVSQQ